MLVAQRTVLAGRGRDAPYSRIAQAVRFTMAKGDAPR